jgi:AAHS family 4-hydroxybenzoate transporter-like MFS transporter
MVNRNTIDVSKLIDDQPIHSFHVRVVILVFLVMITDGYDQMSIGFAAPGMLKALNIDRSSLGTIISAAFFGMLVGAPLSGWIGDRFGRRVTLISAVFIYGIVSLMTAAAQTEAELLVLRFITGVGLSGVVANGVALIAEFAPKRVRATLIVIAQIGLTFGFMLPAAASGTVEVIYGWRSLFVIGGVAPLAIGIVLLFGLPESLKFLVVARRPMHQILQVAHALEPDSGIGRAHRFHVTRLFSDGLIWITPIIWILYNTFLAANYFLHGWMPILFRDEGLTINQTAVVAATFDVGGIVGALVISRLVDRYGVAAIVTLYLLACPTVGFIGFVNHSVYLLGAVIFLAGFCLVGITLGMNAIAGTIYPTEIRAKGVGWAYGVGRFGSMIGPLAGGWLIGMKLPINQLFLAPVVPLSLGTALSFMLMRLCVKRYKGHTLYDKEPTDQSGQQFDGLAAYCGAVDSTQYSQTHDRN